MKTSHLLIVSLLLLSTLFTGCGKGWEMDYGTPAAQFHSEDLVQHGKGFLGKKITVKGTITRVDTSNADSAWVYLDHGIRCHFGKFDRMAESFKEGDEAYVDGFLEKCEPGNILLDPALGRDPAAAFNPQS
jgi:hypothetical protein